MLRDTSLSDAKGWMRMNHVASHHHQHFHPTHIRGSNPLTYSTHSPTPLKSCRGIDVTNRTVHIVLDSRERAQGMSICLFHPRLSFLSLSSISSSSAKGGLPQTKKKHTNIKLPYPISSPYLRNPFPNLSQSSTSHHITSDEEQTLLS